jgi:hypothetical protein
VSEVDLLVLEEADSDEMKMGKNKRFSGSAFPVVRKRAA